MIPWWILFFVVGGAYIALYSLKQQNKHLLDDNHCLRESYRQLLIECKQLEIMKQMPADVMKNTVKYDPTIEELEELRGFNKEYIG